MLTNLFGVLAAPVAAKPLKTPAPPVENRRAAEVFEESRVRVPKHALGPQNWSWKLPEVFTVRSKNLD